MQRSTSYDVRVVAVILAALVAPSSRMVAFERGNDVWVADSQGRNERKLIANAADPEWSPDQRQVAFYRGGNIHVYNLSTRKTLRLTNFAKAPTSLFFGGPRFAWHPGGTTVSIGVETTLNVKVDREFRELATTELLHFALQGTKDLDLPEFDLWEQGASSGFSDNDSPAWSRDGSLAFTRNGDIWLAAPYNEPGVRPGFEITRIAAVAKYDAPTYRGSRENHYPRSLSWSPTGRRLVYDFQRKGGTGTNEIYLLDMRGSGKAVPRLLHNWATDPVFSPDEKRIAYTDGESLAVWVMDLGGKNRRALIANAGNPSW